MQAKVIEFSFYTRERRGFILCKILKELKGKTAKELLYTYKVSLDPPINLTELLKQLGISAIGIDFTEAEKAVGYQDGEILGAAISQGDNLAIFYRENVSENRQRFTIAHELAHCCLHGDNLQENHIELRECANSTGAKEREANIFAGELLIPESSLREVCNKLLSPSLSVLAKIFKVSTNVMEARLEYLSIPYLKDTEYVRE